MACAVFATFWLVTLVALIVVLAAIGSGDDDLVDHSEIQDDFTASQARWGYLHDRRNS